MDYDRTNIPETYDCARDHGPAFLKQWMTVVASHVDPKRVHEILDLGCGTGRFSQGLAARFDANVLGIDPSMKMLRQAQVNRAGDRRVLHAGGCAEAIPLRANSIDMIFISMVFHHFNDPELVAQECKRVLREHGHICLRTATLDQISNYPYVPFFPTSRPLLEQRLSSLASTCGVFEAASFQKLYSRLVIQQIAPDYSAYAEKLSFGADAILASLDPSEFAAGLDAVRSHSVIVGSSVSVVEPIDFIVFERRA